MKPFHGTNQVKDAEKAGIKLFIARCDPSVNFHALKQIFHQVACPVLQCIKGSFFLAIGFGWDDHLHAFIHRLLHDGITIVRFVRQ